MSRCIDADALAYLVVSNGDADFINKVTKLMIEAPSIDIVRCKECKYWHREINGNGVEYINFSKCTKGHHGNGLDFYCADGEREGE